MRREFDLSVGRPAGRLHDFLRWLESPNREIVRRQGVPYGRSLLSIGWKSRSSVGGANRMLMPASSDFWGDRRLAD
jgi:hypothetical protein